MSVTARQAAELWMSRCAVELVGDEATRRPGDDQFRFGFRERTGRWNAEGIKYHR